MSIVPMSLRRAGSDSMAAVSAVAKAATSTASIAANFAEAGCAYAEDYKVQTIRDLASSTEERAIMRSSERAIRSAEYFVDLEERLSKDAKLRAYYEKALSRYEAADQRAVTSLSVAAE